MQDVHMKLNPEFPWQKQYSTIRRIFSSATLRQRLVKCYIWSIALYGAETWTLLKVDQKYLESFEMWCWRRMEKIGWSDRVNNEVLHRVNEGSNILHTIKRRTANWIGHILRRNCFLKHVIAGKIEGKIDVTGS
jgi:hypothetical protein